MNLDEYKDLAIRTAKEMEHRDSVIHFTLGLSSEVGELTDTVKKMFVYNQSLDYKNLVEEIGDVLWYCALAAHTLKIPLSHIAEQNIEKLRKRYPEKYLDELAASRLDKAEQP